MPRSFASLFRDVAQPFRRAPFPAGLHFSALDAAAVHLGGPAVAAAFASGRPPAAAGEALAAFLGDGRGALAVRKAVHGVLENRLRVLALKADPPLAAWFPPGLAGDDRHPFDPWAREILAAAAPATAGLPPALPPALRLRHWIGAFAAVAAVAAAAFWRLLRHGAGRVPRVRRAAVSDLAVRDSFWKPLAAAAEAGGAWRDGALAVPADTGLVQSGEARLFPTYDPAAFRVERRAWTAEVLGPALVLAGRLAALLLRHPGDARLVEATAQAAGLAYGALDAWRLVHNLEIGWLIDSLSYDARHLVRAAVVGRRGGRAALWPATQLDVPGAPLAHLGYDAVLAGGAYLAARHGATWWPDTKAEAVGLVTLDRRYVATGRVDPDYARTIEERLAAGDRVAVFFGLGTAPAFQKVWAEMLVRTWLALAGRPGWFLVVKPKQRDNLRRLVAGEPRLAGRRDAANVLFVDYPVRGEEVCPSGWLIERMAFGVGFGSVQVEALVRRKWAAAFYPVHLSTPLLDRLRDDGLLHQDADAFARLLAAEAEAPGRLRPDYDWYARNFDPFGDGRALERVARLLFGADAGAAAAAPLGSVTGHAA